MIWSLIDPLYIFVLVGLASPGPNVVMVTTSGARFGFKRTIPHIIGIVVGVGITASLTAFGIGAILINVPALKFVLKLIAGLWILWMAYKLALAKPRPATDAERPFTVVNAALFQWINPKVWAVALAASTGFASDLPPAQEALRIGAAFSGLNLFVCLFWTSAGRLLAYLLTSRRAWRTFNLCMSAALAASALLVIFGG